MGALSTTEYWVWGLATFPAEAGGNRWAAWFERKAIIQIDPILDGTRYVDLGGTTYGSLQLMAAFETAAARDAVVAAIGEDKILTSPTGLSSRAALVAAQQQDSSYGLFWASLTFEKV